MAKLQLKAKPTFNLKVEIPVAGEPNATMTCTFKHRTKDELEQFIADRPGKSDLETFMAMVEGWDLDHEFNEENVETILQNFAGAGLAVWRAYVDELVKFRTKN